MLTFFNKEVRKNAVGAGLAPARLNPKKGLAPFESVEVKLPQLSTGLLK